MEKIEKLKKVDIDLLSHQRDWEEFEQNNTLIAPNDLFLSYNSEEIKIAYKSRNNNKHKNNAILLIINEVAKNCHYFAVKSLSELNSLGWLIGKKEAIINNDYFFQNALNDALIYQTIETYPERILKIKPYILKYNWEGIEFPAGPKDWKMFEQNNKTITINILFVPHNTEAIRVACR